jgi:hypothetical protein
MSHDIADLLDPSEMPVEIVPWRCRSGSPTGRSTDPVGDGHVVESWAGRLVGERAAGMVGSRTRCRRPSTVEQSY